MSFEKTTVINSELIKKEEIKEELISIIGDLEEIGYEPIKQLVAYLVSGDPGYISSHKDCRSRILKYKKEDILEIILSDFIENK